MGKSSEEIKKMAKKETAKSPISPIWLGMRRATPSSPIPPPLADPSLHSRRLGSTGLTGSVCRNSSPRLRRLRWHNIRGYLAHLLRRPIIARHHLSTTDPPSKQRRQLPRRAAFVRAHCRSRQGGWHDCVPGGRIPLGGRVQAWWGVALPTRNKQSSCAPVDKHRKRMILRDGVHSTSFLFPFPILLQHGWLLNMTP